jgi:hypothetical protein
LAKKLGPKQFAETSARFENAFISGDRVAAQARSFVFQKSFSNHGIPLKRYLLIRNAYCVVTRPLSSANSNEPRALSNTANAIHGERIAAEAGEFRVKKVKMGSSTHNIQHYVLEKNCYCVVTRALTGLHRDG